MASPRSRGRYSDLSRPPNEPRTSQDSVESRRHSFSRRLGGNDVSASPRGSRPRSHTTGATGYPSQMHPDSLTARISREAADHKNASSANGFKAPDVSAAAVAAAAAGGPVRPAAKLGTFAGVFVPTSLNVFSVLMFLRFGFILGQSGILAMLGMLVACYAVNTITILSLSAIATNGTVRGGGAYYLISRSLGPEFGGSIGVVFYLAQVFNTGLNAVGLIDCVRQNFGSENGNWGTWLTEGYWWQYLWGTVVLVFCTVVCFGGSSLFTRASNGLLFILLLATFSIPFSALVQGPFELPESSIVYTGLSLKTMRQNLLPHLTKGADGSKLPGKENFQDLFGILYPATAGIFAGASMSGSLKYPSKAIPKGTLSGVGLTFFAYALVILAMGATITRPSFLANVNVVQDTVVSSVLILAGEIASSLFSTLMGVIGAAQLLQALARDALLPGASIFAKGFGSQDIPIYSILLTYFLTQITLFGDINQIATLVTMGYLMTFLVMNLACFLLKIGSAPNFRPSFRYFSWQSAFFGTIMCGASMFFVDGWAASGCVALLILVFLIIHYTTPPKAWGDVSQSLIYHQVRKYLLRLKTEHVKFWRPQILLFVNDPRRSYKMIQFCNSLKKGGLFVLGHVIVSQEFEVEVAEARRQQQKWNRYIDFSRIKAFVQIIIAPGAEWGTRNLVLSAGLGGMRPNIVVMGFYNLAVYYNSRPLVDVGQSTLDPENDENDAGVPVGQELPTDDNRTEANLSPSTYVTMLEDLLLGIQINVAICRNFSSLRLPSQKDRKGKKYIDLWPIQMSAEIATDASGAQKNVLTTNFDTYALILQLGCILNTVPAWKKVYSLRVIVFVEYESDVEEERGRVQALLDNLRIRAQVLVFWLASGETKSYEAIVNGDYSNAEPGLEAEIDKVLEDEDWWEEVQKMRGKRDEPPSASLAELAGMLVNSPPRSMLSGRTSISGSNFDNLEGLRRVLQKADRRRSTYQLGRRRSSVSMSNAPRMSIMTHHLPEDIVSQHAIQDSASEGEDSSEEFISTAEGTDVEEDTVSSSSRLTATRSLATPDFDQITSWRTQFSGIHHASPSPAGRRDSKDDDDVSPSRPVDDAVEVFDHATPSGDGPAVPQLRAPTGDERQQSADVEVSPASSVKGKVAAPDDSESTVPAVGRDNSLVVPSQQWGNTRMLQPSESAINSAASSRPTTAGSMTASVVGDGASTNPRPKRPKPQRNPSGIKFSSKPVPATRVATEDGPGPSIMFTESMERPDPSRPHRSIYDRGGTGGGGGNGGGGGEGGNDGAGGRHSSTTGAGGNSGGGAGSGGYGYAHGYGSQAASEVGSFMSAQSVPLSFNDLPCRAQHLILNELMRTHAARHTAVLFTTLPSPAPGTGRSDDDSLAYLDDLDVLCRGLPPTLLVHSNSMTVTMNL